MFKVSVALASVFALAACTGEAPQESSPTPAPTASATAIPTKDSAPKSAEARASGARSVSEETDDFLFKYSYPAEAGNIPELAALLDRRLERSRASLASEAAQARDEARDSGFPYNKYSTEVAWEVVAETPEYLSLSADISSYSGGAHGDFGFDSLVWDKERSIALEPVAFFTSVEALGDALGERVCERLNRRGETVDPQSDDTFDQCVALDETTILLGSRSGRAFDRIGVQIAPYVAGPYAEGSYDLSFDVTEDIIEAVAPEYRDAFAARN